MGWWSDLLDTLDTVHELDFVIDDTSARNPYSTPYEPIDRPSTDLTLYAAGFLLEQGQGNATSLEEAVYGFNHLQREKLDTDWSFTIFVVDSSDDPDGLFASGGTFAGICLCRWLVLRDPFDPACFNDCPRDGVHFLGSR